MLELFSLVTMSILGLGNDLPTDQRLLSYQPTSNVYVENQYGEELFVLGRQNREWADFEDFPTVLIDAVLSAEDKNYWTHDGVDGRALARASFQNFAKTASGQRLIGGSTISQQISKLVFVGSERSLKRKAREMIVAKRMEKILGKSRILELYLNEIYMGRGAYGMKIAAKTYFNKHIGDLTAGEAATLASMIKAPGSYSKDSSADRLLRRRNWVLNEMSENGFLTKTEVAEFTEMPVGFVPYIKRTTSLDTYYEDLVRRDLSDMLGEEKLLRGGFKVVVERDDILQQQMEYSLSAGLEAIDSIYPHRGSWKRKKSDVLKLKNWDLAKITDTSRKSIQLILSTGDTCSSSVYTAGNHPIEGSVSSNFRKDEHLYVEFDGGGKCFIRQVPKVSGAVVAVNANTGAIVATAGGYDYKVSKFNRASQAFRQPGSTIKPLTYSAAFSSGYYPNQLVADAPVTIELPGGQVWQPQNADHKFMGVIQVEEGLYRSRNVPTLLLAQDIGFSRIWQFAQHLGLTDTMKREWTITLGSAETTVVKMASAYIAMLNGGDVKLATTIKQVTDLDGNLLIVPSEYLCVGCREESEFSTRMKSVSEARLKIPEEASRTLRMVMRKVMTQGTGYRLGRDLPDDVIGKTGTTNHARDAWFIGHTTSLGPDPLLIATYIGYDKPQPISRGASGARIAGTIFRDVVLGKLNGDVGIRNKPREQVVQTELYRTLAPLNMRAGNRTSSPVIAVMPKNADVLNVSCTGAWCSGEYKGKRGFFSKRYVTRVNGGGLVTVTAQIPDRFRDLRRFMASTGGTYRPNPNSGAIQTAQAASQSDPYGLSGNAQKKKRKKKQAKPPVLKKAKSKKNKPKRSVVRIVDGVEVTVNYNF